jgi:hypothetical protein
MLYASTMENPSMAKTTKTVVKILHVHGTAWQGFKAKMDYKLHVIGQPELDGVEPKTYAEVKRIAGDFESIDKATLETREITVVSTTRKINLAK